MAETVGPAVEGAEEVALLAEARAAGRPNGGELGTVEVGHLDDERESAHEFADARDSEGDALAELGRAVKVHAIPLGGPSRRLVYYVDELLYVGTSHGGLEFRIGQAGTHEDEAVRDCGRHLPCSQDSCVADVRNRHKKPIKMFYCLLVFIVFIVFWFLVFIVFIVFWFSYGFNVFMVSSIMSGRYLVFCY